MSQNQTELAVEIAEKEVKLHYKNLFPSLDEKAVEKKYLVEAENGDFNYTEEAQDIFNTAYDIAMAELTKLVNKLAEADYHEVTYDEMMVSLCAGELAARKSWLLEGMKASCFIYYKPLVAITASKVPGFSSMTKKVKDVIEKRLQDVTGYRAPQGTPNINSSTYEQVEFSQECIKVNWDNRIEKHIFSPEDKAATDWVILKVL